LHEAVHSSTLDLSDTLLWDLSCPLV
jgi:hypothetical protein